MSLIKVILIILIPSLSFAYPNHKTCRIPKHHVVCKRIVYPDYYSSYAFHASEACMKKPIKIRYCNN